MTNRFLQRLQAGGVIVADGATGTNLQKAGLPSGVTPEDWVFEQPDRISALERSFAEAGADLILTCTFGGTSIRLKDSKYAERAAELNRRAVDLARAAAPDRLIGGSMGPTGQLLKPFGPLDVADAVAAYAEQAKALSEGGVDVLVIETHFALDEAQAAFDGARQVTNLPIVVFFNTKIQPESFNLNTVRFRPRLDVDPQFIFDTDARTGWTIVRILARLEPERTYTVTIGRGVRSATNQPLSNTPYTWRFRIQAPPQVVPVEPPVVR